eukprot:COSAG01_NODE_65319_length_273_cov_1.574713_1_plen_34_part_10
MPKHADDLSGSRTHRGRHGSNRPYRSALGPSPNT